jgi:hypothetical protein
MDLSKYSVVFCDSIDALNELYDNGLSADARVLTSSPALMRLNNDNISHIEARWTNDEMRIFQNTTNDFIKKVFDFALESVDREFALVASHSMVRFNKLIFKAACLNKNDLTHKRLIVKIDSTDDSRGRYLNSPWEKLLVKSKNFDIYLYKTYRKWDSLSTRGVSYFKRLYLAGFETAVYRVAMSKYFHLIQSKLFRNTNKKVLIPNENELLIETAFNMFISGIQLKKISIELNQKKTKNADLNKPLPNGVKNILMKRLKLWVIPELADICIEIFETDFQESLGTVEIYKKLWKKEISYPDYTNTVLFINAPSTLSGIALTSVCRGKNIPIVGFQHGVTKEICATHDEMMIGYESNYSDMVVSYNEYATIASNESDFAFGSSVTVGMSKRHQRMKSSSIFMSHEYPIVYVSTNLYKGNIGLFGTYLTDYGRSLNEQNLISDVLSKIPHKILYKAYPEHYQRYLDDDPILLSIKDTKNIEIYTKKIDMRYLVASHRVFITSKATSTLGWLVMSGKPVIFINWEDNMPLTKEAYILIKNGLFLFDGNSKESMNELRLFLSTPINKIEFLWQKKSSDRKIMIKKLFSSNSFESGKRAASIIKEKYITN